MRIIHDRYSVLGSNYNNVTLSTLHAKSQNKGYAGVDAAISTTSML